ncbi:DUF3046 domain-containing protein [Flaviflexus salsibiostraticola]|uniref:DUF3046 domain-containing protein n=2 Tax=Flaviflexus salsibiostraticola TaxID=1282737 RepID=A0A3S8Z618_9ACTO|nr:DUF3046 domain-containing protein [Flaviflexus salsibiostraticola]
MMNHSEFHDVLADVFGPAYGQALARTLALPGLGHRTADELLEAGESPQKIWTAICSEMNIEDEAFRHRVNRDER